MFAPKVKQQIFFKHASTWPMLQNTTARVANLRPSQPFSMDRHVIRELANARRKNIFLTPRNTGANTQII
jgi:hypothetical protein